MLCVKDIMTPGAISFDTGTPVGDVARDLTDEHIGGAPVVDRGRVVGVVSKTDLVDPAKRRCTTVGEAMQPLVFFVRPDDSALGAVQSMLDHGVHRVIVVKDGGHLAGIVTATDVMRAVRRGLDFHTGTPSERHGSPARAL